VPISAQMNPLDMLPSSLSHPNDAAWQMQKRSIMLQLLKDFPTEQGLRDVLRHAQQRPAPRDETGGTLTRQIMGDMDGAFTPPYVRNLLGTGAGTGLTDGSALIRQDLEPIVSA
jgi:hypothetical protein